MKEREVDLIVQARNSKVVSLATFRRGRSVDNWFLAMSLLGFGILSVMFAAKISPLLGAGGLDSLVQLIK